MYIVRIREFDKNYKIKIIIRISMFYEYINILSYICVHKYIKHAHEQKANTIKTYYVFASN